MGLLFTFMKNINFDPKISTKTKKPNGFNGLVRLFSIKLDILKFVFGENKKKLLVEIDFLLKKPFRIKTYTLKNKL